MAVGIESADAVVTCSPNYAQELSSRLHDSRLGRCLAARGISGILSAIDCDVWDPADAAAMPIPYSARTVRPGKTAAKRALARELSWTASEGPLFLICGRLVAKKGIDLVLASIESLLDATSSQLVVLGAGDQRYVAAFRSLSRTMPRSVAYRERFTMPLARLLYAGSDFLLMPSLIEPCGLSQMIAMRYGTIPIVNPVGGLRDTVVDLDRSPAEATGFWMQAPTAAGLTGAAVRAVEWSRADPAAVDLVRRRGMEKDWSWSAASLAYAELYRTVVGLTPDGEHPSREYEWRSRRLR